ncbi:MAG: hypothetical protein P1U32_02185 [Legionellaceae bacterium]|nr:hypothetical protein [Legionellaceae bacterium]
MAIFKSFKYRNKKMMNYGRGDRAAGPTEDENQLVSDWDRYARGVEVCPYYIHGINLSEFINGAHVRKTPYADREGFFPQRTTQKKTKEELEALSDKEKAAYTESLTQEEHERKAEGAANLAHFFEENLFNQVEDKKKRALLVATAMAHFHQGGLPHATNLSINKQNETTHKLLDPERRINFEWTDKGLIITEENTYKKWVDSITGEKHECRGNQAFYAETKSVYLLTPDAQIQLLDLQINCPSSSLAEAFDKRPAGEQPYRRIREFINFLLRQFNLQRESLDDSPPEKPDTLYRPPQ